MSRILLADDDRVITHLVSALLTRLGHQVETAATVEATTARLTRDSDVDLVLLDLNMPDGTAHDVLRRLEGHALPPIVLLTGASSDELEELARDARVRGMLSKPVTPETLEAALGLALAPPDTG